MKEAKTSTASRSRGRPMSSELHDKVIATTWGLLADSSVGNLTIKGIADAAGTTRAAIYRRWSNVEDIAVEAFLIVNLDEVTDPSMDDPEKDLKSFVRSFVSFMRGQGGRVIAEILGQAQSDPALLEKFHEKFVAIRRDKTRALIERGQQKGAFHRDEDVELAIDLIAGPIYYRLLSRHAKLDDKFADNLANRVLRSLCVA